MNPSSACASVLVDELVRGGVREVVLAPGSRSAPLAHAVLAAEAEGRLRLHVRVDERSAAFLALGLATVSRAPVVVVTTSGTAVANLHPAVLEAHHARVPLVVLSADRPHELRGTGANQTTTQPGIFGEAVRWSADLPAAERRVGLVGEWRSTAVRALAAARGALGGDAGPVHLDVAFREPLVPDLGADAVEWPEPLDGRPGGAPWARVGLSAGGPPVAVEPIEDVERTLVVVGDLGDPFDAARAVEWGVGRGHPVVAEPFGTLAARGRALPHGPLLLSAADWLEAHAPERVVVVGRVTLARPVASLLRRPGLRVEVVTASTTWSDPSHVAARVHRWEAIAADHGSGVAPAGGWASDWRHAGRLLADAVAAEGFPWPSGLGVAATVAASVPDGAQLVVGSSNPVRDLDLATTGRPDAGGGVPVHANRGLAGIDGVVSTAVGVALGGSGPTYALLGDLTFLHDANGLLIGPDEPRPDLTLVVVNDDGGGIFTTLEPGAPERATTFERLFGTPTGTDLAALCRAHGVRHDRAEDADRLARLVAEPAGGLRVLEVPVDRATHRRAHAELRALAADALAGEARGG